MHYANKKRTPETFACLFTNKVYCNLWDSWYKALRNEFAYMTPNNSRTAFLITNIWIDATKKLVWENKQVLKRWKKLSLILKL